MTTIRFRVAVAVVLEELHEEHAGAGLEDVREELAAELSLLSRAAGREISEGRVEPPGVHSDRVVAPVDVCGMVLVGGEAPVDPSPPASRGFEGQERPPAAGQEFVAPWRRAERGGQLLPSGFPLTWGEPTINQRRDHQHNIPVVLPAARPRPPKSDG